MWSRRLFARRPARWGFLLLAIWLIATGMFQLHLVNLPQSDVAGWIMAVLAIVAGILIVMDR